MRVIRATLAIVHLLVSLAFLVGFYVLGLGFVAVTGWLFIVGITAHDGYGAYRLAVTFPVDLLILFVLLLTAVASPGEPDGTALSPHEAPELWGLVTNLARRVGTRAPDEILLIADMNAAVLEESRLLGLVGGKRRMYIGLPLLRLFSEAELAAVLCHELGHYSGGHGRLGAASHRSRIAAETLQVVLERLSLSYKNGEVRKVAEAVAWFVARYMFLVRWTASGAARQREAAADRVAAAAAGREAFQSALEKVYALGHLWERFARSYIIPVAAAAGAVPADPAMLFVEMALDPSVAAERAILASAAYADAPASRFDSHPSVASRLALLAAQPTGPGQSAEPAWSDRLAGEVIGYRLAMPLAPAGDNSPQAIPNEVWRDLAGPVQAALAAEDLVFAASRLNRPAGTVAEALALLEAVPVADLKGCLPRQRAHAPSGRTDEQRLVAAVTVVIGTAFVAAGRAAWRLSWSGEVSCRGDDMPDPEARKLAKDLLNGRITVASLHGLIQVRLGDLDAPISAAGGAGRAVRQTKRVRGDYTWGYPPQRKLQAIKAVAELADAGSYIGTIKAFPEWKKVYPSAMTTLIFLALAITVPVLFRDYGWDRLAPVMPVMVPTLLAFAFGPARLAIWLFRYQWSLSLFTEGLVEHRVPRKPTGYAWADLLTMTATKPGAVREVVRKYRLSFTGARTVTIDSSIYRDADAIAEAIPE